MTTFVTGGMGFIGSNFVFAHLKKHPSDYVFILDNQSYASNANNILGLYEDYRVTNIKVDIRDRENLDRLYKLYTPDITYHFAAESHVDNSIAGDDEFLSTNINGTHNILKCILKHGGKLVHVSTDEVFGSLGAFSEPFNEHTPYNPRNPYSATKAASDHLVRAYVNTHRINAVVTNCSNNYGPHQHAEKFIPTIIRKAKANQEVPIYGTGLNIRDWLYVEDHCDALLTIGEKFVPGDRYNIGGGFEINNLDLAYLILKMMGKPNTLVHFVHDRKGHDFRYAMDTRKMKACFNWEPKTKFIDGLEKTLRWYNA
jgi:dTDP-glucose 4,6-dehydratase